MKKPISFRAEIIQYKNMNAGYILFPFSTEELFGKKGQVKIKALFDDKVEYRGILAKMKSENHLLILTQAVRKALEKSFGDYITVKIWEDIEDRVVDVPEDVKKLLNQNKKALEFYEKLSYTHKKEYIRWIEEAKKEETRERRKQRMIEMLLEGKKGI